MRSAIATAACAVLVLVALPARAQTAACPERGVGAVSVSIDSPRPGEQVAGMVTVTGRVETPLTVSRVELVAGPSTVDAQSFTARSAATFRLSWDSTGTPTERTTLRVVACGNGAEPQPVRGSSAVVVEVVNPARSEALSPALGGATQLDGEGGGRDMTRAGRLLTAPSTDDERPSGPLWVGAVFGLAGVAGLWFSSALGARRRAATRATAGGTAGVARRPME